MPTKSRTAAERTRAADIRDWAAANGLTVAKGGRIPAAVITAYDAAMTVTPDADPGPDWGAAVADALDLDSADLTETPPAPPVAGGTAEGPGSVPPVEPGPPPPASLDEARERLSGRPGRVPPWAGSEGGRGSQRPAAPPVRITRALQADIEGKLALLLTGPVTLWEMADPACGGAMADNLDTAVKKAVPLICQSPEAVRLFTTGGNWILWLDLIMALMPVGRTVFAHHYAGTVTVVNGRPVPARRLEDGSVVPADHAAAEPAPDWSAYGTTVPGHVPPVPDPARQAASIRQAAAERRAAGQ